jgi:peptidoglycan/xylan/chitin deacetylase (PgdA/CDA1 family)
MVMDRQRSGDRGRRGVSRRRFLVGALGAPAVAAGGFRLVTAQAAAGSITRGPTEVNRVALTFDCGADLGHTASILDTLASNGIRCSFGMTGQFADNQPDMVRRMVAEGHHLINHTYTHPSFTGASTGAGTLPDAQRREQIESTENRLVALAGVSTKPYFRPPYGDFDQAALDLLGEIGYPVNALWTLDVNGWRGLTREQIVDRVATNHGNGYIYLMHVGWSSQEGPALPQIITTLRGYGYGFATLPGLLSGEGTDPTPPPAKFVAGDTARVTAGLYLRTGAGTGAHVLTTMPTGTVWTVIAGATHS